MFPDESRNSSLRSWSSSSTILPKSPLPAFSSRPSSLSSSLVFVARSCRMSSSRVSSERLSEVCLARLFAKLMYQGIILGPSVLGNIPNFAEKIFPQLGKAQPDAVLKSLDTFGVVANMGLIFFMFLMGLELETEHMTALWKTALPVAGMCPACVVACSHPCSCINCVPVQPWSCPVAVAERCQQREQRT
jgi:hypothetical protein